MMNTTAENTRLRLKAVLDVLTEGVWREESLNAGVVLAEAISRVPLNTDEAQLLGAGIPRGHKTLTTATARLVKAGWLVKGRSGWTITEDGMRATVAFPDADTLEAALDAGTPVPADTPVPVAPTTRPAAKKTTVKKAAAGKPAVKKPAVKKAAVKKPAAKATLKSAAAPAVATVAQPEAVAVVGDFNIALGAPANWAPQYDEAQMTLDALDQLWQLTADLPAGRYNFKIALNRSWDENYGAFGAFDGANHELHHDGGSVTVRYDHRTRDVTIN